MHIRSAILVLPSVGLFALASAAPQQRPNTATAASQKAEPCWEQAGISKNVIEQRRSIQENTRSQIQAVCSEPNLSEQQKREKIRQIHQAAQAKVNAMISPAETQRLEECRRANHMGSTHAGSHGGDPCAGLGW